MGIDPSFTGTGIAKYDGGKQIQTVKLSTELDGKRFVDIVKGSFNILSKVEKEIEGNVCIISENPPPQGMFASGLYGLDTVLLGTLSQNPWVRSVDTVNPNYLQHLHQKRKYTKGESVKLAQFTCTWLGLIIVPRSGRLSSDEAEAILFLIRLLVKKGCVQVSGPLSVFRDAKEVSLIDKEN